MKSSTAADDVEQLHIAPVLEICSPKRTLYARFSGKAALLQVVVARLMRNWLTTPKSSTGAACATGCLARRGSGLPLR